MFSWEIKKCKSLIKIIMNRKKTDQLSRWIFFSSQWQIQRRLSLPKWGKIGTWHFYTKFSTSKQKKKWPSFSCSDTLLHSRYQHLFAFFFFFWFSFWLSILKSIVISQIENKSKTEWKEREVNKKKKKQIKIQIE